MFPDGTIDLFKAYDCFLCGEICNSGDDFFYHLVDEHNAEPMKHTIDLGVPEDVIVLIEKDLINACLLAAIFGQTTIMNHMIKENVQRIGMIKNVKI